MMPGCLAGLLLTAATLAIHAAAIVMIWLLIEAMQKVAEKKLRTPRVRIISEEMIAIFMVGSLLALLNLCDAFIWSLSYLALGAIPSLPNAIEFSLDRMATLGSSKYELSPPWTMMGPLEAADGMLLFGVSTAFLFAVMNHVWSLRGAVVNPAG